MNLLLLLGMTVASAQDELSELLAYDLEALMSVDVVSASRRAQSRSEAPANVLVISREQIRRRGYRSLHELLMDVPGVDVATGQPAGEYPTHFVFRGVGDVGQTKVLVMVDGVVRNDISNGWARLIGYEMHLLDVERVEIVSGPGSVFYGANAYAGVIHVITRDGRDRVSKDEPVRSDARVALGSWATVVPELALDTRLSDDLVLSASGRFFSSRGDQGVGRADPGGYFNGNREPWDVLTTELGLIPNDLDASGQPKKLPDGYDNSVSDSSYRVRLRYRDFTLGLDGWDRREGLGTEVVGYEYFANTPGLPYQAHHRGFTLFAHQPMDLSDRVWTESRAIMRRTLILPETAFVYTFQYQSVDLGAGVSTTDKAKRYLGEGSQYGAEQLVHVVLQEGEKSENVLTVGGIGEHLIRQYFAISLGPGLVQGSSVNPSTYPTETQTVNPTYFTNRAGFYVNDEHTFGRQRASAGVRMDLDSLFGLTVNPRAGLVLSPVEKLHLKALYGEAYKAPTIFELYDEWRGNLELTPEKIRTVELIAELFPLEDAHLSVGAFHSNADNLILVAPNRNPDQVPIGPEGQRADYYQNRGDVQWMGMTVLVDAVAADILRASANYSMTVGSALQPLDNVSTHKVNAALNLDVLDRADVNLRMNWASRVKAPETNLYWQPRDRAFEDENYPYVRARGADGFGPGHFLTHLVVTGRDLFPGDHQLRPQLAILNLFDARWLAMGRQAGSGVKPQDPSSVSNPAGFSPPYHPQPGREIWFQIQYEY